MTMDFYINNTQESFYIVLLPTLIILKLIGYFPYKNILNRHQTYKFKRNLLNITTVTMWVFESYALLYDYLVNQSKEMVMRGLLWILIQVFFFKNNKKLLKLFNSIEDFDTQFRMSNHSVDVKRIRYRNFFFIIQISLAIILMFSNKQLYFTWAFCETIVLVLQRFLDITNWLMIINDLFLLMCYEFSIRFYEISVMLDEAIKNIITNKPCGNSKFIIEEIRIIHGQLGLICKTFFDCYIPLLMVYFMKSLWSSLTFVYHTLYFHFTNKYFSTVVSESIIRLYGVTLLYFVTYSPDYVMEQVSNPSLQKSILITP